MTQSTLGIKLILDGVTAVKTGLQDVVNKLGDIDGGGSAIKATFAALGPALVGALSTVGLTAYFNTVLDGIDDLNDLADATGSSVEELSKLERTAKLNGGTLETVRGVILKFNTALANADGTDSVSAALTAIGLETKALKELDPAEALKKVATAFDNFEDSGSKARAVQELFGKSIKEAGPLLKDLADDTEKGATVTTEQAKAAEELNKQIFALKTNFSELSVELTNQAIPTLNRWANAANFLFENKEGISLFKPVLINQLQGAFRNLNLEIEQGVLADLLKAKGSNPEDTKLDALILRSKNRIDQLSGAATSAKTEVDNLLNRYPPADQQQKNAEDRGFIPKPMLEDTQELQKRLKAAADEQKRNADEAKRHSEELDKLAGTIKAENSGLLGDYPKNLKALNELRATGRLNTEEYEKALKALIDKQPIFKKQAEDEKKALEEAAKAQLASVEAYEKAETQIDKNLKSAQDLIDEIVEETKQLTLSNTEREIANGLLKLEKEGLEKGTYAYDEYAKKLKAAIYDREQVRDSIDKAKEIETEWKKLTDSINEGLTDAIFRGFESGKGFFDTFKSTLVNAFKNLVLQPTIRAVLAPISGAVGGLFGMGNAAAGTGAAGGGGGLGSLLSSGMDLLRGGFGNTLGLNMVNSSLGQSLGLSSLQNIGGNMIAGPTGLGSLVGSGLGMLGNGFMGYGISKALSGGYSAGGAVNTIAGIASAIPGIGPIAGVVGALVNRAFGMRAKEMKDAGITGTITGGDVTGNQFQDWFQKGGWFRSNKSGSDLTAMNSDLAAALDLGASGVLSQVQAYAAALQLPGEALKSVSSSFRVTLTGQADADQKAIATVLEGYQTALSDRFTSAIAPLMKAGETASEALKRLAGLQSFTESINLFGGVFSRIAGSSIAAREHLIELAGGIEQLMAKAGAFVRDYYSASEQAGLQARGVSEALAAAGIAGGGLGSREDFRRLVESLDVSTEQGRTQLNALLDIGPQFAQLADYLAEQQITLEQAVAAAPQIAALEALRGEAEDQVAGIDNIGVQIEAGNSILAQISSGIAALQASIEAGLAQVASNTQATTRLLDSWDDGGAMNTVTS